MNTTSDALNVGVRILIVDDEQDGVKSLAMLLQMRGYLVETATNGEQCLASLESFRPEVILLDIGMPKISGYEVAKQIRADSACATSAIIAVSGFADEKHKQWSFDAGCDQHLVKPADLSAIEAAIAREIDKRRSPSELPTNNARQS